MNKILFYGTDWCPDCARAKRFLEENGIAYTFINVDIDKKAKSLVEKINAGKRIIPTLIIHDKPYANPQNNELACLLGINKVGRVVFYGADWCPDCKRAKRFLNDHNIYFEFIDVDKQKWAAKKVEEINNGKRIIPTVLINAIAYTNPTNAKLTELLSIDVEKEEKLYDTIIVGGGAAGLTASIYAQRDRFDALILEKKNIGGNAYLTQKIENYPGFQSISGPALMEKMELQAKTYGAVIKTGEDVTAISAVGNQFAVNTANTSYRGKTVILATGSTYRKLHIPNEDELIGSGVHFCATCDGAFYRDKDIIVVGGGNSALEEGIFLAGFCKSVKIVGRSPQFNASPTYIQKLPSIKNISTVMNQRAVAFVQDKKGGFEGLRVEDNQTKEQRVLTADGAFIFIGLIPNTEVVAQLVSLNAQGFIQTTGLAETSVKGLFAAGDCREGAIAQVAAATGEGILASYGVRNYLK